MDYKAAWEDLKHEVEETAAIYTEFEDRGKLTKRGDTLRSVYLKVAAYMKQLEERAAKPDAALTERDALQELAVQLLTLIEVGAGNDSPEYTAGVAIMAGAMGVRVPAHDAGGEGGDA